jgi:hypothetical protein
MSLTTARKAGNDANVAYSRGVQATAAAIFDAHGIQLEVARILGDIESDPDTTLSSTVQSALSNVGSASTSFVSSSNAFASDINAWSNVRTA